MNSYIFAAVALAAMGIAMVVAGIFNLKENAEQEKLPPKKHKKKTETNLMANWMLGGHRSMDLKKQGRLRIQVGSVFIAIALLVVVAIFLESS
ncbi:hypothetical protein ACFLWJ_00145 [Chloroflexota bacterium]